jgi:hypothetical protein
MVRWLISLTGRIQDSNWPSCVPTRTPRSPATVGWVGRANEGCMGWIDWAFAESPASKTAAEMSKEREEFIGGQFSWFRPAVPMAIAETFSLLLWSGKICTVQLFLMKSCAEIRWSLSTKSENAFVF